MTDRIKTMTEKVLADWKNNKISFNEAFSHLIWCGYSVERANKTLGDT
jgi:hypothetical protein